MKAVSVKWADAPAQHDSPADASFLRLMAAPAQVEILTALQAPTDTEIACRLVDLPAIAA